MIFSGTLLLIFFGLMFLVNQQVLVGADTAVTLVLQTVITRVFDMPLSFLSLVGSSEVTLIIVAAIAGLIYLKTKKIFYGAGMFFVIYIFELIGKIFIYHPGPPREFFRYDLPFSFPSAYVHTNYSFPSGHVSRTVFIAVLLLFAARKLDFSKRATKLVFLGSILITALMIVSRIYLGEHWFTDVLGGTLLGSSMGILAMVIF